MNATVRLVVPDSAAAQVYLLSFPPPLDQSAVGNMQPHSCMLCRRVQFKLPLYPADLFVVDLVLKERVVNRIDRTLIEDVTVMMVVDQVLACRRSRAYTVCIWLSRLTIDQMRCSFDRARLQSKIVDDVLLLLMMMFLFIEETRDENEGRRRWSG
eukprot:scaffold39961_cov40-Cyclotella_meneghiniana.AAC.2